MTELDDDLVPEALALVNEFGMSVTVTAVTREANPATGAVTKSATEHSVKCTPPEPYRTRYVDGDVIKHGDAKVYFAASGLPFTPAIGHQLTIGSDLWTFVSVDAIRTGDLIALWGVQVRK